jgi:hypothetical protein
LISMDKDYFKFSEYQQEPEELDYHNFKDCPNCKKPIPQNSTLCFYCGKSAVSSGKHSWIVITAFILIVIFILFILL